MTEAGEADLTAAMGIAGKQEREAATDAAKAQVQEALAGRFEGREKEVSAAFRSLTKSVVRRRIVTDRVRIDGRGLEDIRQLLDLYDIGDQQTTQIARTCALGRERLGAMEAQRAELDLAIADLRTQMTLAERLLADRGVPPAAE